MADFKVALAKVAKAEGGYTQNPKDNGNWTGGKVGVGELVGTNYGISAPVYANWIHRAPTIADMKAITHDIANAILKKNYWDVIGGDKIANQSVANMIFDMSVNEGSGKAASIVSDSLGTKVSIPFVNDVNKINAADQAKLFDTIKQKRAEHYNQLGGDFLGGWLKRLDTYVYSPISQAASSTVEFVKKKPLTVILVTSILLVSVYIIATSIKKKK